MLFGTLAAASQFHLGTLAALASLDSNLNGSPCTSEISCHFYTSKKIRTKACTSTAGVACFQASKINLNSISKSY